MAVMAIIPSPQVGEGLPLDKALHLGEYSLLAWCIVQAVRASAMPQAKTRVITMILSISYGALLEGVQSYLPYRQADWFDLAANTAGAALGLWLGFLIQVPQRK